MILVHPCFHEDVILTHPVPIVIIFMPNMLELTVVVKQRRLDEARLRRGDPQRLGGVR